MLLAIFFKISDDFRKFSKYRSKVVRIFPNIFWYFPKLSERDLKMFLL